MGVEEILDEEAFDPKKLFNQEEYSTLIFKRDGFSAQENEDADLIESLLDSKNTRAEDEVIYKLLKEANAQAQLINAIQSTEHFEFKSKLIAACWESGLDFNKDILCFAQLTCDNNYQIAIEALTVIDCMDEHPIDAAKIEEALAFLKKQKEGVDSLKNSAIQSLQNLLSNLQN